MLTDESRVWQNSWRSMTKTLEKKKTKQMIECYFFILCAKMMIRSTSRAFGAGRRQLQQFEQSNRAVRHPAKQVIQQQSVMLSHIRWREFFIPPSLLLWFVITKKSSSKTVRSYRFVAKFATSLPYYGLAQVTVQGVTHGLESLSRSWIIPWFEIPNLSIRNCLNSRLRHYVIPVL